MYLNGQCKCEEDIVTLMVYLLMTKLPKNADLQAKAKDYDLSLLVPKGTKVNAVKEQFKAAVKTTERVPKDEAMVKFIALLAQQPGYGEETYDIIYTDLQNKSVEPDREHVLALGPYSIQIRNQRERTLVKCPWSRLISSTFVDNKLSMRFISHDHRYCDYVIKGEYLDQIYMFITQMMAYTEKKRYLMTMEDIVKKLTGGETVE